MSNSPDVTRREFIRKSALSGAGLLASEMVLHDAGAQDYVIHSGVLEAERLGANSGGSTVLENEFIRIELDAKNGDITGLLHKRTGKEYTNLTDSSANGGFELDARHYGIAAASYTTVSPNESSGVDSDATEAGALLVGSKKLAPNEVVALIFKRKEQPNLAHETAVL